jgi:hypothetical protein
MRKENALNNSYLRKSEDGKAFVHVRNVIQVNESGLTLVRYLFRPLQTD